MGCCSAPVQPQTGSEPTPPAGNTGAEEAPPAPNLKNQTTTQSMLTMRSLLKQPSITPRIEKGDFVHFSQDNAFDLEVIDVVGGNNDKDNSDQKVKVMGRQEFIPRNHLVKFSGPRLRSKDIKSGAQVQFNDGKGGTGTGVIDGQTNSEVCVKTEEGSNKLQQWVSLEDIHFLYVMVFSAHSLKNTDKRLSMGGVIDNRSDPYIKIHLQKDGRDSTLQDKEGKANHMHKTEVLDDELDPVWNQDFRFLYFGNVKSIRFEVRDSDVKVGSLKEDDFLGHAELPKAKWEGEQEGFLDELTLTNEKDEPMKDDQGNESKIKVRVKLFAPKGDTMDIGNKPALFCCGSQMPV